MAKNRLILEEPILGQIGKPWEKELLCCSRESCQSKFELSPVLSRVGKPDRIKYRADVETLEEEIW